MKKRILTVLLAVCLVVALGTVTAAADGDGTTVNDAAGLQNAVSSGGTVVLDENITLSSTTLTVNSKVTLDLNGHKLDNSAKFDTITVENGGDLTIIDSAGGGVVDNTTHGTAAINNKGGIVILDAGTYTRSKENGENAESNGGNSYYNIVNHGTMTINDGVTVTQTGAYSSMVENGWYDGEQNTSKQDSVMVINGGTFSGGLNTIKNDDYGKLTINGGTFTNVAQAAVLNWNVAEITGGTFEIKEGSSDSVILNGYLKDEMDKGQLTITGGTFNGNGSPSLSTMGGANHIGNVEITGGRFDGNFKITQGAGSVTVNSATITGNIINNSTSTISVIDANVTGNVMQNGNGSTTVIGSTVGGKVSGAIVIDSNVSGEISKVPENVVAVIGGKHYESLAAAIIAASTGDTITLVGNVVEPSFSVIIENKAITIDGNGHTADITVAPTTDGTIAFDLYNSDLTLTDLAMTINGSSLGGTGFDVKNNGSSLTLDNADVKIDNTKRGIVFSIDDDNLGEVYIINGSSLTFDGLSANCSNGGVWTISDSTVDYINLGATAHAMSVETAVINDSTITVDGAGLFGLYGADVTLNSGTIFNINNAGYNMPYENWNHTETYNYPVEIKAVGNASLTINEGAVLNVTGCTTKSGTVNNNIYVVAGTTYTNNGTVNANVVMEAAPAGQNTVKVINNGVTIYSGYVADNTSFKLPTPDSRNGYTFGGWRGSDGKVYEAGATVKVNTNMTFTAIWNAINIPDTYDIDLIVSDGGEAKTNLSNASAGTTITVTATPDEGYKLDYITVDGERISGTSFKMPAHDVTVRVYFTDGSSVLPFTDVRPNQWFYDAISYVYTNGMMEGDSATTFNPDGQMTRAMFWAVLGRIDGANITGANWVETARNWAMSEGVSDGTDPNGLVTREMMVTMLWRYVGEPESDYSLSAYTDANSVSDWAAEAMAWAVENGVISGVSATTLAPQGTATRAQCATIFMRYDADIA